MNILLLTHSYPDKTNKWRGIFIQEQAKAISTIHNVYVVYFKVDYSHFAPFPDYTFLKKQTGNLIEYEVTIRKSFPVINQLTFLLGTYRFIKKEILNTKEIELINSHLSYPAGFLGTIIQKRKKIPNIITEHSRIRTYFRSRLHKKSVIYALKNSSGIISVSNALQAEIVQIYSRPVTVIPNLVDTSKFKPSGTKSNEILNIGFLGGLGNNNKGLDLLLRSASLLQKKNFLLHIGGAGILLDSYRVMAKDLGIDRNCRFYGEILTDDIAGFYSRLDIFVLPSRYETFGIVLIEAMACGIPVIATKCGGPEEIVSESTGILVKKDNVEELAAAIKNMSENKVSYNKEAIREYVLERFGQPVFIDKMTSMYQNVLMKYSTG